MKALGIATALASRTARYGTAAALLAFSVAIAALGVTPPQANAAWGDYCNVETHCYQGKEDNPVIEDGFALWVETYGMEVPNCADTRRAISNEMWVEQPYTYPGQWVESGTISGNASPEDCNHIYRFYDYGTGGTPRMFVRGERLPMYDQVGYIIEDYHENGEWEIWWNEAAQGRPNTWWRPASLDMPFLYGSRAMVGTEAATEYQPFNYGLYAPWSEFYHSWENWREVGNYGGNSPLLCMDPVGAERPAEVGVWTC